MPSYGIGHIFNTTNGFGFYSVVGYPAGDYYGYYLDSLDGNAENSIVIENAGTSNNGANTSNATIHGMVVKGSAINDLNITNYGASSTNNCLEISFVGTPGNIGATNDLHFIGLGCDDYINDAVKIDGINAATFGSVNFESGHMAATRSTGNAFTVSNSSGVSISGMEMLSTQGYGVFASNSTNLGITNNLMQSISKNAISFTGVSNSTITGNRIFNPQAHPGAIMIQLAAGSKYNSLTGNSLSGYATYGISISDTSSVGNQYCGSNTVDPTNIGTPYSGDGYVACGGATTTANNVYSDSFPGVGPLSSNWTQATNTGDPAIVNITQSNGQATSGASGHGVAYYTGGTYGANQFAQATFPVAGGYEGLLVRASTNYTTPGGYLWAASAKAIYLSGTSNFITAGCPTVSTGDTLRLSVSGSTVTCLNVTTGVSASAVDTTFTSGYAGITTGAGVPAASWRGGDGTGN